MAEFTIKKVAEYLDKLGLRYQLDRENEQILTGYSGDNGNYLFVVRLQKSNNTLFILTPSLAKAHEGEKLSKPQLSDLLEALLNMNYTLALGCFERDSSDGEIRFRVSAPTENDGPTREQFTHLLMAAFVTVDRFYPEIQRAIYGGEKVPKGLKVQLP